MSLGIILKGLNACHFGRYSEWFFEFLPQLIMLLGVFGFMDALIIAKWLYPYGEKGMVDSS